MVPYFFWGVGAWGIRDEYGVQRENEREREKRERRESIFRSRG